MRLLLLLFLVNICNFSAAQHTTADFSFRYEYKTDSIIYTSSLNPHQLCAVGNRDTVKVQFDRYLKQQGAEGWEVIAIPVWRYNSAINDRLGKTCHQEILHVTVVFKKLVFNPEHEVKKQVEFYSRHYADSIQMVLIDYINNVSWEKLGTDLKKQIVDDIIKKMKQLAESNEIKIVTGNKRN